MTDLRTAAQQALDDLRDLHANHNITYAGTISRLEAALAQQAEPVEPVARDDIIRMAREAQQEQLSLDGRSPSTALRGYWLTMEVADLARFAALVADRLARHGIPMPGDPK